MSDEILESNMISLAKELWPICRSLTGPGVRQTFEMLKALIPIEIHEVPSGTQCFDWTIPNEWTIRDAWIKDGAGKKIVDFKKNNLHVLGYSIPIHKRLSLQELQSNLHSLPGLPKAIPYMTSYYRERWGFCLSEEQRRNLADEEYEVLIDSDLKPGSLTYADIVVPGETAQEIFFSTYVCHPSLANNELSGPVVTTFLAKYVMSLPKRKYSYRFVFIPETIGSICYLSRNIDHLKRHVVAGFNVTCVGDERAYSYMPSRTENTISDRMAKHVLRHLVGEYTTYSFSTRGSDERQYCSPGVDLPIASVMRSKYGTYPEYHTSLDNFDVVTGKGLYGGFNALKHCVDGLEANMILENNYLCEPQLGKRGLYPTLSTLDVKRLTGDMMDLIMYSDGATDLLTIAEKIGVPIWKLAEISKRLLDANVLRNADKKV